MDIEDVVEHLVALGDVAVQRPGPGDGTPEIAWGDVFVYYSPDGSIPAAQPFVTVVTKDYPGEPSSGLARPDAIRVNVHASREEVVRFTGHAPGEGPPTHDGPSEVDTVIAHPTYGAQGWLSVVDPDAATEDDLRDLLTSAHGRARARWERRTAP